MGDVSGCSTKPVLLLHDVGLTFGKANRLNGNFAGSVNLDEWSGTPIWKDEAACVGHLSQSHTGTLGDPIISEAGRSFLAGLLVQLTDEQLRDLFDVARVNRRSRKPGTAEPPAATDEWGAAFRQQLAAIVAARCR